MNVNVTTTPALLSMGKPNHVLVQNIGDTDVFMARGATDVAARGIRIEAGDAIELTEPLKDAGRAYYVATESGTSSVRYLIWN